VSADNKDVTFDFDEFWAEKEEQDKKIKVFGKVYSLPPSPRAGVILRLMKMRKAKGDKGKIPEEELIEMAEGLIGPKEMRQMFNDGLTISQLEDVMKKIWELYSPTQNGEADSGNSKKLTSLENGNSSKQTSKENTESTS